MRTSRGSERNTTLTMWYTRRAKRYARSGVSERRSISGISFRCVALSTRSQGGDFWSEGGGVINSRQRSFLLAQWVCAFYTLYVLPLPMVRPEFPSTPINAHEKSGTPPDEQDGFVQPTLEGIELEQTPEIELGNCIITTTGKFRKLVRGNEWHCNIHVAPDLLHPEQEGDFEAHAYQSNADMAKDARLRPGDRALMR